MARRHAKARRKPKDRSVGLVHIAQRGYGFVTTPEGEFFIQRGNLHGAMDGDLVDIARLRRLEARLKQKTGNNQAGVTAGQNHFAGLTRDKSGRLQMQAGVVRVIKRAHQIIIGVLHFADGLGVVIPEDKRLNFDVFMDLRAISKPAKDGDMVAVRLTTYPSKWESAQGYIEEVLGHSGDDNLKIDIIIRKYNLETQFSDGSLEQAQELAEACLTGSFDSLEYPELQRIDLREREIFTIDPVDAKDFDDALSLEWIDGQIKLGVHIADVSALVPWDSSIDLDARKRSTSVYLPDRVIPMLPEQLSNQLCSLQPNQDRLALTVDITLSLDAVVSDVEFYPSIIRSNQRLDYQQVQRVLDGEQDPKISAELLQKLNALNSLAKKLSNQRQARGALDFDSTEQKVHLDVHGKAVSIELKRKTEATALVEEAMILANETVASFMLQQDAAMIYRIHDQPLQSGLDEMLPILQELGLVQKTAPGHSAELQAVLKASRAIGAYELVSALLLRSMKRARYNPNFTTHFGLASSAYTHFTSPIRRYPDLMAHRLLKQQLLSRPDQSIIRQLAWISEHCSDGEHLADKATGEALKFKLCEYMSDKIGTSYLAVISGVNSYGFFVKELSTYVEGFVASDGLEDGFFYQPEHQRWLDVDSGKSYRLGQSLRVGLAGVDISKSLIEFVII